MSVTSSWPVVSRRRCIPTGRCSLTLLAAMAYDDHLLVLADDKAIYHEPNVPQGFPPIATVPTVKFSQVGSGPLMWGLVGTDTPKERFGRWIGDQPRESWDLFVGLVADEVAGINGAIQTRATVARAEFPDVDDFSVMLAGYIGSVAGIMSVDKAGGITDHLPFGFLGPLAPAARITWQVVEQLAPESSFRAFLDVFGEAASSVFPPINAWSITADGINRLP
jgi:hypothetical protein